MARLAAQARAYYYPTPSGEGRSLAEIFRLPSDGRVQILDPCAGRGELILPFVRRIGVERTTVRAVELDYTRWKTLQETDELSNSRSWILNGDSWRVEVPRSKVGLLLLNPPYDCGLEVEWFRRWWVSVEPRGGIVIIVPAGSVAPMVRELASNFTDVRIARFSDGEFEAFKQVAIVARRRVPGDPDPAVVDILSQNVGDMPVLGTDYIEPVWIDALGDPVWGRWWSVGIVDIELARSSAAPWTAERRRRVAPVPGSLGEFDDLAAVVAAVDAPGVEVLIPPTPAHVSNMLAAGVLDGAVVAPDDTGSGLPPIAIRGTYARDWVQTDRRYNSDREVVAVVEQQVPVLTISVIDLTTGELYELVQDVDPRFDPERYAELRADPERWAAAPEYLDAPLRSPLQMFSAGDLLLRYSRSVREVLASRCRVEFDPATDTETIHGIDVFPRQPFRAQRDRIMALLRWVRGGRSARIPGQTGTGKTTVAAMTAAAYCIGRGRQGISRVYIHAPAHLVHEWVRNQIPSILGESVEVVELDSMSDVDRWMRDDREFDGLPIHGVRLSFGVVSRSRAKLGYIVEGIDGVMRPAEIGEVDGRRVVTRYRATCPGCGTAFSEDSSAAKRGRSRAVCDARLPPRPADDLTRIVDPIVGQRVTSWESVVDTAVGLAAYLNTGAEADEDLVQGLTLTLHALPADGKDDALRRVLDAGPASSDVRDTVLHVALAWNEDAAGMVRIWIGDHGYSPARLSRPWMGRICGTDAGTTEALKMAVDSFRSAVSYTDETCGEVLWTASASLGDGYRRYPLARYVHRRYRGRIDFAISDEAHEAGNPDSAQSQADQFLYQLGCPFLSMTGTTMNGYPRSLHVGLYYGGGRYREDFAAGDASRFQRIHGYNRRVVEEVDDKGRVVARGSTSAARMRVRPQGTPAPGITPAAVVRYVVPAATPLRLVDLDLDLPGHSERTIRVDPDAYQVAEYRRLARKARDVLKRDAFTERSGALLGAVAQIGSILDRNIDSVGNNPRGGYEIRYPERFDHELVVASPGVSGDVVLPKEAALISYCLERRDDDGRVIVSVWYTSPGRDESVSTRIVRLLTDAGLRVAHLDPAKVPTRKRITWIDRHVIGAGVDALVVQPRAVETGINNLVYFDSIADFDGIPSPNTRDQLMGRIHRPGKTRPTEMVSFVYCDTIQVPIHEHQMRKVAVSRATDGGDPREALRAVGADGGSVGYGMSLAELIVRSV